MFFVIRVSGSEKRRREKIEVSFLLLLLMKEELWLLDDGGEMDERLMRKWVYVL